MNIGDMVVIKECHKMPDLVGKTAKVVAMVDPELSKYPIQVTTVEPMAIEVPGGVFTTSGPFPFREDELELADPTQGIPEAFLEKE